MNGGIASPSGEQGSGGSTRGQRAVDAGEGVGSPEDGQRVEQADSLCASGRGDAQRVDDLGDLDSLRFDEPMNECIEGRCVEWLDRRQLRTQQSQQTGSFFRSPNPLLKRLLVEDQGIIADEKFFEVEDITKDLEPIRHRREDSFNVCLRVSIDFFGNELRLLKERNAARTFCSSGNWFIQCC